MAASSNDDENIPTDQSALGRSAKLVMVASKNKAQYKTPKDNDVLAAQPKIHPRKKHIDVNANLIITSIIMVFQFTSCFVIESRFALSYFFLLWNVKSQHI